ncbi:hypothetical protein M408DRAFT_330132 [Serendipita vermifera MAFF 305830]|uniref:Zn(2)-C6 fungal-type domain-containing protein n=1 Tax=Serendipita vermifera MAFF 305830 TaxID=933852 RepID=A0A0C2XDQ8_SERVB|nr:hypothetical protein M408DRAFT_330132 [Serendipita vermifera MAFF 305830]
MDHSGDTVNTQKKREGGQALSKARNCAECRRLKIKCDRQVPCSNCVKRGTSAICPDGHLLPKGQRLILASTEQLHTQIDQLTDRTRELEEALANLQAQHSNEPHPLLSKPDDLPLTSFGSLMIKEDGNARFFGATSSVEWIMAIQEGADGETTPPADATQSVHVSVGESSLTNSLIAEFPLSSGGVDQDLMTKKAIAELPPKDSAINIVDCYYLRAAWEMNPVLRGRFIRDYFVPCYENQFNSGLTLQEYALIYSVYALGMLHNPEVPNYRQLAAKYAALSRACLAVGDFISSTSLCVIDTLLLCATYHHSVDDASEGFKGWALLGVALKLAIGMGLHREPSMWGLSPEECSQRRRTMWELVSCDLWASLITGRPPMISRQHFDVKVPLDEPEATDADPNFSRGKHHFSDTCLWVALDLGLASSNKTTYAAVMQVDTKIRNWKLPQSMHAPTFEPSEEQQTVANFRDTIGHIVRELVLLCLHRTYFAGALLEPPYDPLGSVYARSVLAAYGSACAILGKIRSLYSRQPILMMRVAIFWTYAFTAAVTLGSIAARAPDCRLAPTALVEFNATVDMFRRAQGSYRARRVVPALLRLQEKAHEAFNSYRAGTWVRPTSTDDQLRRGMGGSPSIEHVRRQERASPPAPIPPIPEYPQPEQGAQPDMMSSLETIQPSLDDYLRSFEPAYSGQQIGENYNGGSGYAQGGPLADIGMSVPSSDAFLHGVLTGQWDNLNVHSSGSSDSGYHPVGMAPHQAPMHGNMPGGEYGSGNQGSADHSAYSFRPSPAPPSDVLSSNGSPPRAVHEETQTLYPPSLSYQPPQPMYTGREDTQSNFMWDNFLRELGIQNYSS